MIADDCSSSFQYQSLHLFWLSNWTFQSCTANNPVTWIMNCRHGQVLTTVAGAQWNIFRRFQSCLSHETRGQNPGSSQWDTRPTQGAPPTQYFTSRHSWPYSRCAPRAWCLSHKTSVCQCLSSHSLTVIKLMNGRRRVFKVPWPAKERWALSSETF